MPNTKCSKAAFPKIWVVTQHWINVHKLITKKKKSFLSIYIPEFSFEVFAYNTQFLITII